MQFEYEVSLIFLDDFCIIFKWFPEKVFKSKFDPPPNVCRKCGYVKFSIKEAATFSTYLVRASHISATLIARYCGFSKSTFISQKKRLFYDF